MRVVTVDWADLVEREGVALADAVDVDPGAAVPAAPGWDATELLRHVGTVHGRARVVLETGTLERPTVENGMLADAPRVGVGDWYRDGLAALVRSIRRLDDPDRPVYSFAPMHRRAGFWPRRVVHETSVHRVDAEQAVGRPVGPLEPLVAVDGIDELLTVFVPMLAGDRSPGDGRSVHLHATDAQGEWLVTFEPGGVRIDRGHVKGDAAVRGPGGRLFLWLWGRVPLDELDVVGDAEAAQTLRTISRI
jgi:uncharacterized protein (TIGR03083 family)